MKTLLVIMFLVCLTGGVSQASSFYQVGLDQYANWDNYFDTFPTGDVSFDGIPFHLRDFNPAFICTAHTIPGWSDNILLPTSIAAPRAVHLLINGGNMYLGEMGVQVGTLRFVGAGASSLEVPLIGGVNIREWSPYSPDQVINTLSDPNAKEVWSGIWNGYMTVPARVDLYTVYLPEGMESLQMIEIHDLVDATSIQVYGVTVETVPEPSSILALVASIATLATLKRRKKG